ncbi:MAG: HldE protein [Chlamydiia bacterium]|nr:HldE protein [Chlamydiia bacterium]
MVKLIGELSLLKPKAILLAGDLMLDRYTIGKASRISPEAPVPVLLAKEEKMLPGGAGNVALGLKALGQKPMLLGRVGNDSSGDLLKRTLEDQGIHANHVYIDNTSMTPVKNRLIADHQQMLRIDHENVSPLSPEVEAEIIERLPELLSQVSIVALSDYGKGFLTESLIQAIIVSANEKDIPVIIDPKGIDFTKYRGAYLVKPNLKEAYQAAKAPADMPLDEVAMRILEDTGVQKLMITRSEEGISIFDREKREDFPVQVKEVVDVTGAGDTVLAMLAATLASKLSLAKAASLSNVAASLALEHVGCHQVTLNDIVQRLLDQHAEDKLIESIHRPALEFALKDYPHSFIEITDETALSEALYEKIRALKVNSAHTLVMQVDEKSRSPAFLQMLASLKEVDFILKT